MSALQTGFNVHSMRIHGSGLNPLPICFDRVCTILLQSELDSDELYVYIRVQPWQMQVTVIWHGKKDRYPLIFLAVFVALHVCATLRKSRLRRERLIWKQQQRRWYFLKKQQVYRRKSIWELIQETQVSSYEVDTAPACDCSHAQPRH